MHKQTTPIYLGLDSQAFTFKMQGCASATHFNSQYIWWLFFKINTVLSGKIIKLSDNVSVYRSWHLHCVAMFGLDVGSMLFISEHANRWKLEWRLSVDGCPHLQVGIYWRVLKYWVYLHILNVQCHDTKQNQNWTESTVSIISNRTDSLLNYWIVAVLRVTTKDQPKLSVRSLKWPIF